MRMFPVKEEPPLHTAHEGQHQHQHSIACGHTKIRHGDHIDYIHSGHLHKVHDGHADDCVIAITTDNPAECRPVACGCGHETDCGHERVPHGDHVDFLVRGRLHHPHGAHCDDHGPVELVVIQ